MQAVIGFLYYIMAAVIGVALVINLLRTRDPRKMVLYVAVLTPFVLRVLRIK